MTVDTKRLAELADGLDDAAKFGGTRKLFADSAKAMREHIALISANEALRKELASMKSNIAFSNALRGTQ